MKTENATALPRSFEQVLRRYAESEARDPFGFERDEYLYALDYPQVNALGRLADGVTEETWSGPVTVESLTERAKGYIPFWLEKIEGERGLSVCRATQHFTAWKWLLGHDDADTFPGSFDGPDGGWYQQDAYDYVQSQIESGEFDRLTQSALVRGAS